MRHKTVHVIILNYSIADMESLPSLQSLHQSLVSEEASEAEEELLSVISHLLVCAVEDPGIPNPVRHTTLLGQSLRTADITNSNISEILRIYLYAVATGEVRTLTGATLDRERERRVADHHQLDSEQIMNTSTGKNHIYYERLHENTTWKLSESLKDKPFVALNPTVKTQILAHLCNDLLLNKAVLKQIDGSLDSMAQHKREKFLIENRIRKYKHLHTRKVRIEQFEKQQLLIKQQHEAQMKENAERIQAQQSAAEATANTNSDAPNANNNIEMADKADKVDASTMLVKNVSNLTNASSLDNLTEGELNNHKEDSMQSSDVVLNNKNGDDSETQLKPPTEESKPIKMDVEVNDTSTRNLNNGASTPDMSSLLNKKIVSRDADASAMDSIIDDDISDLESEGTILEEDEDNRMTSDEVQKKLDKIFKSSYQNKMLLEQSCNQLRATCFGQDRYWRRYWHLPKTGGIFVEGMESAQNEIVAYHERLEELDAEINAKDVTEQDAAEPAPLIDEEHSDDEKEDEKSEKCDEEKVEEKSEKCDEEKDDEISEKGN